MRELINRVLVLIQVLVVPLLVLVRKAFVFEPLVAHELGLELIRILQYTTGVIHRRTHYLLGLSWRVA